MTHLIDKDVVVAKLNRLNKRFTSLDYPEYADGYHYGINSVISFIDALKVKEVDLDEAARKWEDKVYLEKGWQDEYGTPHAPFSEIGNAFMEGAKFILKAQKGE